MHRVRRAGLLGVLTVAAPGFACGLDASKDFVGYVVAVNENRAVLVARDPSLMDFPDLCSTAHYYGARHASIYVRSFAIRGNIEDLAPGVRVAVHDAGGTVLDSCPDQRGADWIVILD